MCQLRPDLIASYTSVEGNFTLKDAFWTGALAVIEEVEVAAIMNGYRADPGEWFSSAGVATTPWTTALAKGWLDNQPATTIQAQAKAVVTATSSDSYLLGIKEVLTLGIPIYLIAGEKSAVGWDVPDWVNAGCTIRINIPGTGHFMMAEEPELFARSVLTGLSYSKAA
nr:hypothetical protein [Mesorhizobium delmotii]